MARKSFSTIIFRTGLAAMVGLALLKSPLFSKNTPAKHRAGRHLASVVTDVAAPKKPDVAVAEVKPVEPVVPTELKPVEMAPPLDNAALALGMAHFLETRDGKELLPTPEPVPEVSQLPLATWEEYSERHGFAQFEKELSPYFNDSIQSIAIMKLLVINRKGTGELEEDPRQIEILNKQFEQDPVKSAEAIKRGLAQLPRDSVIERNYLLDLAVQLSGSENVAVKSMLADDIEARAATTMVGKREAVDTAGNNQ